MEADAAQQPSKTAVGDGGRYVLGECLARSTAVSVYAAFDARLSREVVVKVLKAARGDADTHAVARAADLLAGARLAARLQHPSVVTLFDAGLCGADVYIAMERLEGSSLHDRLAAGWRPSVQETLRIGSRIAAALAFVHEAGLLHGRVEPSHVLLLEPTQLKLLNCGLASPRGEIDATAADALGERSAMNSLRYRAPEVLLGAAPDAPCDVYGLGLVMYEMLARRAAFSGDSAQELRNAVLLSDLPGVHTHNPAVPQTLSSVVARATARDPALRPQSMRELLNALKTEIAVTGQKEPTAGRDRRRQAAAACAGLMAASAVGFFAWRERATPAWVAAPTVVVAHNAASAAASTPAPGPPANSMPLPGESVAPAVVDSAVRPLAQIRQAAAADRARARATPPMPKTSAAPTRPVASRPVPPSAGQPADLVPTTAALARQPETAVAAAGPAASAAAPALPTDGASRAAAAARGAVVFAVEPGGAIEINGVQIGTTPPLRRLTLPNGKYEVTIRNDAFQPHVLNITVNGDKPVNISHRFAP